jgi:hypothetical protein
MYRATETPMQGTTTVYALRDPRDGRIRYVGSTSLSPLKRFAEHHRTAVDGSHSNPRVAAWIRELVGLDLTAEVVVIEVVPNAAGYTAPRDTAERYWTYRLYDEGEPLLNGTCDLLDPDRATRYEGSIRERALGPREWSYQLRVAAVNAMQHMGLCADCIAKARQHVEAERSALDATVESKRAEILYEDHHSGMNADYSHARFPVISCPHCRRVAAQEGIVS